jgi:hypothetical protein
MTEEEAKKKWCPMANYQSYGNRPPFDKGIEIQCIASDCMMWRGIPTRDEAENGFYLKDGYCGLGGKP